RAQVVSGRRRAVVRRRVGVGRGAVGRRAGEAVVRAALALVRPDVADRARLDERLAGPARIRLAVRLLRRRDERGREHRRGPRLAGLRANRRELRDRGVEDLVCTLVLHGVGLLARLLVERLAAERRVRGLDVALDDPGGELRGGL